MRSTFRFCLILLAACVVGLPAPASALVVHSASSVSSDHSKLSAPVVRSERVPASAPNTMPFTLSALAGVVGATKARKLNLSKTYLFNGQSFGPGTDVEVPEGFPDIDGETGNVVHAKGSVAERNQRSSGLANGVAPTQGLGAGTPASTGTNGGTVSGKTEEELSTMKKEDLVALAEKVGVTVVRADGTDGEPLKDDYVAALGASA